MITPDLSDLFKRLKAEERVPLDTRKFDARWFKNEIENREKYEQEYRDWLDWLQTREDARY